MSKKPQIVNEDPWLEPFTEIIRARDAAARRKEEELIQFGGGLKEFASGYLYYGLHRTGKGWVFREWAPNATKIFMIGDFNHWEEHGDWELKKTDQGNWEITLEENKIKHLQLYKLSIYWQGGKGLRIPAYANRVVQDENTKEFSTQVWNPPDTFKWKHPKPRKPVKSPVIYETHVGMATEEGKVGSFNEFTEKVIPYIARQGYNTIQLMAIQEHPYYGSFGYHVSNFYAVSSRFGTPEDLKILVDTAHSYSIAVIMDIVHSHSVKNVNEGLAVFDGNPGSYFHNNPRREHIAWDSLCFDYGNNQVLHFLLSNCRYWIEAYNFDGFRFDGITSMIYLDHGLSRDFTSYEFYYDGNQDGDALIYLTLANKLIHSINPDALSIAEEMSGMPGLAEPVEKGGLGFDFRLAMGLPDYWIKIIKEKSDEQWNMGQLFHELVSKRTGEKTISYCESHDQALVGDKTIIFRLLDKDMYWHMNKESKSLIIERGMALHKMIRLITFGTNGGGYLNFMGNEFGHPEWIDFPREGNNWSYHYARRQWNLVENIDLRYHLLGDFDRDMIERIAGDTNFFISPCNYVVANEPDLILSFERNQMLFVFNFNPGKAFTDYGLKVVPGKYKIILSTDSEDYGGFGNIDDHMVYYTQRTGGTSGNDWLKLYLPPRTAIVLKHLPTPSVY